MSTGGGDRRGAELCEYEYQRKAVIFSGFRHPDRIGPCGWTLDSGLTSDF